MLKIIAPPLGAVIDGAFVLLHDEVDPVAAGLTDEDVQTLIGLGVLAGGEPAVEQVVEQPQETVAEPTTDSVEQPIPDLDPMLAPEAIAIIKTIHDANVLRRLLAQEGTHDDRKTVIAAIHKQLESLQEVA